MFKRLKNLLKKEEPIIETPQKTEEGAKEFIKQIEEVTKSFHQNKENTRIQPVNRHGAYGFALRRANKLNRKSGRKTPSYPPASYI